MTASRNPILRRLGLGRPYTHGEADQNLLNCMRWAGPWNTGDTYEANRVVTDQGWLMISNKQTADRAAPQPIGAPSWCQPDIPSLAEQTHSGAIWGQHIYTMTQGAWLTGVDIWVPEVASDTTHRLILGDVTDPNPDNHQYQIAPLPTLTANEWNTVSIGSKPVSAGHKAFAAIETINNGNETTITGGWTREGNAQTTPPSSAHWRTQTNASTLRIHYTDLDTVDRATELQSITAGSQIQIVDTGDNTRSMTWHTTGPGVAQGTYIDFQQVTYDGPGPAGEPAVGADCFMTATVPVPAPAKYSAAPAWYAGNPPSWATVETLLRLSGVDQPADQSAFGIRLQAQPAYISPDWDFMSFME